MDKKLLKKYATTAHHKLLSQITPALTRLNEQPPHKFSFKERLLDSSQHDAASQLADLQIMLRRLQEQIKVQTLSSIAEQISYTCFNQLNNLRFLELCGWLPELVGDANIPAGFWQNPKELLILLQQVRKNFPTLITMPNYVNDFFELIGIKETNQILQPFVEKLLDLPEANYEHVEILGWLYQYYNADEKLHFIKRKKPYPKSAVPVVTQIFTPDFIVKYLVDNSLGQLLVQQNLLDADKLDYRVGTTEQLLACDIKNLKFLDPCCGSGHILIYAYELLFATYQQAGFAEDKIAQTILQNNLYGTDIDDYAVQITKAALLFKAREHDQNFFKNLPHDFTLNIYAIPESDSLGRATLASDIDTSAKQEMSELMDFFANAKEVGSLLVPPQKSYTKLAKFLSTREAPQNNYQQTFLNKISDMLAVTKILQTTYDVVVTNPPYINTLLMNTYLKKFVTKNYEKFCRDVFACFVQRCQALTKPNGFLALMTPNVWLSTTSFASLRDLVLNTTHIRTLMALAPSAFFTEAAVDIVAFILQNSTSDSEPSIFIQLSEKSDLDSQARELRRIITDIGSPAIYRHDQAIFTKLPDQIIPFTADAKMLQILQTAPILASYAEARQGIITGDNARFLRYWTEVPPENLGVQPAWFSDQNGQLAAPKWLPHNKGGTYRKWYGNHDFVIDWPDSRHNAQEHQKDEQKLSRIQNMEYNFRPMVSWSAITSGDFAVRFYDERFTFNVAGPSCFAPPSLQNYILGFLNSCVAARFTAIINPTMNLNVGDVSKMPFILNHDFQDEINELVTENVRLAKADWDMYETSWDFSEHPLLLHRDADIHLADSYQSWHEACKARFSKLKRNEERLNEIFIQIYQLKDILQPEVADEKVSMHMINPRIAAKTFLSYFVGAKLGRFDHSNTKRMLFYDTIIEDLREFLNQTCGVSNIGENLAWLADALGKPTGTQDEEFLRQYFMIDFYRDHLKTYHDRPIYWQFDAGMERSLRGIFYAHSFNADLLTKALPDKIQSTQENLLNRLNDYETRKNASPWPTERKRYEVVQSKLINQLRELNDFSQKLAELSSAKITLDFDLGILPNYAKLAPTLTALQPSRYMRRKQEILR